MSVAWVGAGIAAVGVISQHNAAGDAADAQQHAADQAADATAQAQRDAQAAQQPFLNAGYASVNRLQELLGIGGNAGAAGYGSLNTPFTPGNLAEDPGYKFQLEQGQSALDRKAAAGGGFYSGQGLQGAATFSQGLAGTTYNDAFNRHQVERANVLNPLQSMSGQGQTSANATGQIGMNGANSLASLITGNANAQGAAGIAQANTLAGGLNSGLAAWQRAQYMQQPSNATNWGGTYGGWGSNGLGTTGPVGGTGADPWYG